jgi:Domain of unknown function (DUF4440)
MATNPLERELLDLEKQYWRAIQERNIDTVMRLTDDSCILTGAQGASRIDKKTLERMMTTAPWTLHEFAFAEEPEVRQITDDNAAFGQAISNFLVRRLVGEQIARNQGHIIELDALSSECLWWSHKAISIAHRLVNSITLRLFCLPRCT